MPDKKLTDSEIKKALECCVGDNDGKNCFDCPLWEIGDCQEQLLLYAIDLINRQKAEIERLKNCVKSEDEVRDIAKRTMEPLVKEITREQIDIAVKLAKTEAYKEFAERLKENSIATFSWNGVVLVEEIDNLLKELVGEQNG